jgi:hypothetical protein
MSEQTEPIEPVSTPPAESGAPTTPTAAAAPIARRSVTVPLLPLAIIGGVIVALLFFGGGVALGYGVASHDGRPGNMQQYGGGQDGANGNGFGNGFGQNQGGQNNRPGDRSTTAPNNG